MPPTPQEVDERFDVHAYVRAIKTHQKPAKKEYKLKKLNIFFVTAFHMLALYGLFTKLTVAKWQTYAWTIFMINLSGLGVSAGIHRYWSHRSYKAKLPLKIFLTTCYMLAGQLKIIHWVRDHRVHHKYSETEADPHDTRRGLFFAHLGWFMCEKSPQVSEKGRQLDLSDVLNDPVAAFHDKHFELLRLIFCYILPSDIPVYFWAEDAWVAFLANCVRYVWVLNITWSINSFAHRMGPKPYDRELMPSENQYVSLVALGEGWHNYHHVFPYDYRSSEMNHFLNPTKKFIELMAKIGLAYDLRTPSDELVRKRVLRTGDGSHETWGTVDGVPVLADCSERGY
ncbi:acyl-CoA Delta-9 desaturase-like [Cloeon dipterum]|uniref:acyl-CoA Delta-9 desaturase-like n=1 Tax=Cloeon dipterum TaxID=197152 RepID=UPI00321FAC24